MSLCLLGKQPNVETGQFRTFDIVERSGERVWHGRADNVTPDCPCAVRALLACPVSRFVEPLASVTRQSPQVSFQCVSVGVQCVSP